MCSLFRLLNFTHKRITTAITKHNPAAQTTITIPPSVEPMNVFLSLSKVPGSCGIRGSSHSDTVILSDLAGIHGSSVQYMAVNRRRIYSLRYACVLYNFIRFGWL